jgi:DNA-directed RNA polymerase specialized sigma24 family protein
LADPAEEVALVAQASRELLLRVHRHRLRREDLEDCLSQATLELVAGARQRGSFADRRHVANALEQRFLSRIFDRRRALSGRSPMQTALEEALPLNGWGGERIEIADTRVALEELIVLRHDLRRVSESASELTLDQRTALAWQVGGGVGCEEFCRRFGWSPEKYRKVLLRARLRLRLLLGREQCVPLVASRSEKEIGTHL